MDVHARAQFDFFLHAAIERFVDRVEQRCGGPVPALQALRDAPEGEGVWLTDFATVLFQDFALDNAGGAAFVLQALGRRPAPVVEGAGLTVEQWLVRGAIAAFAQVLRAKTDEALEQRLVFQVTE
jgi:hypothetical protein